MNNYTQPYFGNGMNQGFGYQPMYQNVAPNVQPTIQQPIGKIQPVEQFVRLQGKSVDSVEVVKAMDIPLDGSISYFPLTDGSAIVTKQLQADGTSKTMVYKPLEEKDIPKQPKYLTIDEFNESMKKFNNNDFKEDIKSMKRQIKDVIDDIKDIKDDIKDRKD